MQHLVRRFHVLFQNAVKLEGLPVGQADAAINRVVGSELIDGKPLRRRDDPARQTAAQHHGVTRLQLLLGTFGANIAVILLIHTVKTDQQKVIAGKAAGEAIVEILNDGAT